MLSLSSSKLMFSCWFVAPVWLQSELLTSLISTESFQGSTHYRKRRT